MDAERPSTAIVRSGPIRYAIADRFGLPRPPCASSPPATRQICPQRPDRLTSAMGAVPGADLPHGEDCLNLVVAAPPGPDSLRPVMVFIHGGSFSSGGGLLDCYDGSSLAADADVVVVSINYRLGVFGYLCLDGISSGNLGLWDQLQALRWVKANIGDYGGDADNVTVFGQSAGAHSIRLLLEIPQARGLFRRAIMQSGPGSYAARPRDEAEQIGRVFAAKLGTDPCGAAVEVLLEAQRETAAELSQTGEPSLSAFMPVEGAEPLPVLGESFAGNVAGLDVLCGWNADDTSAFTGPRPDSARLTDRVFGSHLSAFTERLVAAGSHAHTYRLDWRPPGSALGATHGVELPLLLGTPHAWSSSGILGDTSWSGTESIGRQLRMIWGHFARTGRIDTSTSAPLTWNPPRVGHRRPDSGGRIPEHRVPPGA